MKSSVHIAYGKEGEVKAVEYLEHNGYVILDRNFIAHKQLGEVDIVAKKNDIIVFVEVKTRSYQYINISQLVNKTKQKKIIHTSLLYLQKHNIHESAYVVRYDICYINNDNIEYFENAFIREY
jgi:putative endonuclease